MPPPVPPSVNDGRMTAGKPTISCTASASGSECATADMAEARPMRVIACLNCCRSSAISMAAGEAPISCTP